MRRVLVTGATGFIGRAVCRHLLAEEYEVVALSRRRTPPREFDARIRFEPWDARSPEPPLPLLATADAVINLAGEPIGPARWTAAKKDRIRRSRLEVTRALATALREAEPLPSGRRRVLVSASAVGYYGDRGDEELTEESPPGEDFLATVAREWEAAAREAEPAARVVLFRMGVVLGRNGGALPRMLPVFRLGLGGPFGSGQQWFPWIHIADVAGLYRFALEKEIAHGAANAVAPEPVRQRDFCRALAEALHRPCLFPVPAVLLRLLFGEMATMLLGSQRVLPTAPQRWGYPFRFPTLAAALHDLL